MPSEQELSAAVDRLRQCRGGNKQTLCEVYQTPNVFDAQERHAEDESLVACEYLELGERQPDEQRAFADGRLWNIDTIDEMFREDYPDAKLVRVATFIQEVQP